MPYNKIYAVLCCLIVSVSGGCQGNLGLLQAMQDEEYETKVKNINISIYQSEAGLQDLEKKYRIRDKAIIEEIIAFLGTQSDNWQDVTVVSLDAAKYAAQFNYQNKYFTISWNDQTLLLKVYETDYEQQFTKKLTRRELAQYQRLLGIDAPVNQNLQANAVPSQHAMSEM